MSREWEDSPEAEQMRSQMEQDAYENAKATSPPTLRHLAEAATPGPWIQGKVDPKHVLDVAGGYIVATACSTPSMDGRSLFDRTKDQAAYIAAASPDVVLALLDERDAHAQQIATLLEPLKAALDRTWTDETPQQIVAIAGNGLHWRDREIIYLLGQRDAAEARATTAEREREELKAEIRLMVVAPDQAWYENHSTCHEDWCKADLRGSRGTGPNCTCKSAREDRDRLQRELDAALTRLAEPEHVTINCPKCNETIVLRIEPADRL